LNIVETFTSGNSISELLNTNPSKTTGVYTDSKFHDILKNNINDTIKSEEIKKFDAIADDNKKNSIETKPEKFDAIENNIKEEKINKSRSEEDQRTDKTDLSTDKIESKTDRTDEKKVSKDTAEILEK